MLTDNFTKLLIATGVQSRGHPVTTVEIIDLSDEKLICEALTSFPLEVRRAGETITVILLNFCRNSSV